MNVSFDADRHLYFVDGVRWPSVTQMISGLNLWDTTWFTEAARVRGSHVHACVHLWIRGGFGPGGLDEQSIHPPFRGYVDAAIKVVEDSGTNPREVETEVRVVNEALGYCGTADWIGPWINDDAVLDWKSGVIGEPTGIQTALYDMARPLPNGKRRRRIGAQLRANGTYRLVMIDRALDPQGLDYRRGANVVDLYKRYVWPREVKLAA